MNVLKCLEKYYKLCQGQLMSVAQPLDMFQYKLEYF